MKRRMHKISTFFENLELPVCMTDWIGTTDRLGPFYYACSVESHDLCVRVRDLGHTPASELVQRLVRADVTSDNEARWRLMKGLDRLGRRVQSWGTDDERKTTSQSPAPARTIRWPSDIPFSMKISWCVFTLTTFHPGYTERNSENLRDGFDERTIFWCSPLSLFFPSSHWTLTSGQAIAIVVVAAILPVSCWCLYGF